MHIALRRGPFRNGQGPSRGKSDTLSKAGSGLGFTRSLRFSEFYVTTGVVFLLQPQKQHAEDGSSQLAVGQLLTSGLSQSRLLAGPPPHFCPQSTLY